jgi:hypothetical protein
MNHQSEHQNGGIMAKGRVIHLSIDVTVPANVGESEVERAINAALDESPETGLEWGNWIVGAATVVGADAVELND